MRLPFTLILILLTITAWGLEKLPQSFSGRCIQIDPSFPYYLNRSKESIAEEIKAQGYKAVSLYKADNDLAKVLKTKGILARYMVPANVGYPSNGDLPQGWEKWKMVLRNNDLNSGGLVFLCENDPDFRKWKKQQIADALNKGGFAAVDIVEPYLPACGGPGDEYYGCLCDRCKAAFTRMYPEEKSIPEFDNANSPTYWKTDTALYKKWVDFRVATVVDFLNDIVNGPGGIREKCPGITVCTWSIGMVAENSVEKMREWEASDGAVICSKVHPDAHCIQTDWPDWVKQSLSSNYPMDYKPFIEAIRKVDPRIPLVMQTDIGSNPLMRRSREWIDAFEKAAKTAGFCQTLAYEYHIGLDMYTKAPKLVEARLGTEKDKVTLVFDKRLDPSIASDLKSYSICSADISSAKVDGNLVTLSVRNVSRGDVITVLHCADDPSVRWSNGDLPANSSPKMSYIIELEQ